MGQRHLNVFYPQWQGGGKALMDGALELDSKYLQEFPFVRIPVSSEAALRTENGIIGYASILKQLRDAHQMITAEAPDTIFTVGGGCDSEIPAVSYLNNLLQGDLTVLWIDAHGDLNTPESSESKKFHGMPLRTLLGEGNPQMVEMLPRKLDSQQLILVGQRSLDAPEAQYIQENAIEMYSVEALQKGLDDLLNSIEQKSKNVYIHIDLDVLDFGEFPFVNIPEADGLKVKVLLDVLRKIDERFHVKGMSLLEYTGSGNDQIEFLQKVIEMGTKLGAK